MKQHFLFFTISIIAIVSCSKDQLTKDDDILQDYIQAKSLKATKHASGLYYIINKEGTGANPSLSNTVTVHYKGFLTDGTQFDGTTSNPITFPLSNLIQGWQIGIPLIKKGGDIKLLIPSTLGYGTRRSGSIAPNSVLVFDIQLVDFK